MIALLNLFLPLDNITQVTFTYINLFKVSVTRKAVTEKMSIHPDFPSMLAISDILHEYGIENYAVRIDKEKIENLSSPFITQIKLDEQNDFTIVKSVSKENIEYLDPITNKWKILTRTDFVDICSGIVLMGEVNAEAGEKDYKQNRIEERQKISMRSIEIFFELKRFPESIEAVFPETQVQLCIV